MLVDYNQNAWGRTLASVYSVRPNKVPSVSTPVTWKELERGIAIEDFRIDVMMGDGALSDLAVLEGGEVAPKHPSVALEVLAGVDGERLVAAHEVDRRELRVHRVDVGHLDGAHGG